MDLRSRFGRRAWDGAQDLPEARPTPRRCSRNSVSWDGALFPRDAGDECCSNAREVIPLELFGKFTQPALVGIQISQQI